MTFRITISLFGLVLLVLGILWFAAFRRGRQDARKQQALPDVPATYRDGTWFWTRWAYSTGRNSASK